MLIGKIVFPFALGIQCFHENEKKLQTILVVVFSRRDKGNQILLLSSRSLRYIGMKSGKGPIYTIRLSLTIFRSQEYSGLIENS